MSVEGNQTAKRLVPNNVLIAKRKAKGWSRLRAARELERAGQQRGLSVPDADAIEKAVYRHETGRAACRDQLYIELYCLVYEATPHELFGDVEPATPAADTFGLRSHKFVCAYIGPDQAAELVKRGMVEQTEPLCGLDSYTNSGVPADGECHLYTWPFGVAILHLCEEVKFPSIANLATWRRRSYIQNLDWASGYLSALNGNPVEASYVLSLYWLHSPMWSGPDLDTAARIMSTPRVLLERDSEESESSLGHAELVERSLFAEGFDHPEIIPFGLKGISAGYASWSGVVYCPLAPRRALAEDELVTTELATQAMWAYCQHINGQIEQGKDPDVPDPYGWRFLRGVRSRLTNARPQETGQHRSMRTAILDTSGLIDHLTQAIDILRETSEG
ncbi:hypothetical protein [Microbispora amethystogenes]|uniref:Transcriptional regulator n=1 Tax=Microbispora amethystogenes TaxID=1427754 RepID=A0ABQ4FQ01_9ACTN|nr:hypothetical protein [Microbispora amethystogenes]GIH36842.1 transcriptional regulator [Microbispora amethystogenes]